MQKNHTVTQSTFANPCSPLAGGFDSGLYTSFSFFLSARVSFHFFCQHPCFSKHYQRTLPPGAVPSDRHQPCLGILSSDWSLPAGYGLRCQPWRQIFCFPGSCNGKCYRHRLCFYGSCIGHLDFYVHHFSGPQGHRWWQHFDFRARKYHRAARRHHHL